MLGLLPLPSSAQAQATPSFEQESAIHADAATSAANAALAAASAVDSAAHQAAQSSILSDILGGGSSDQGTVGGHPDPGSVTTSSADVLAHTSFTLPVGSSSTQDILHALLSTPPQSG